MIVERVVYCKSPSLVCPSAKYLKVYELSETHAQDFIITLKCRTHLQKCFFFFNNKVADGALHYQQ